MGGSAIFQNPVSRRPPADTRLFHRTGVLRRCSRGEAFSSPTPSPSLRARQGSPCPNLVPAPLERDSKAVLRRSGEEAQAPLFDRLFPRRCRNYLPWLTTRENSPGFYSRAILQECRR